MADAQSKPSSPELKVQPEGMEQEADLLAKLAEVPSISKAWITSSPYPVHLITVQYSQRDVAANAQRKSIVQYTVMEEDHPEPSQSFKPICGMPVELKDVLLTSPSPSGKRTLMVRAGKEGTSTILEFWGEAGIEKELHVPEKLHGSVFVDGWFSTGASWDPDEQRIAYVAEVPAGTETPEWGGLLPKSNSPEGTKEKKGAAPKSWRGVGEWQARLSPDLLHPEDWGELYTGKKAPAVVVADLRTWTVQRVKGLPADHSFGQPVWAPDGKDLVIVAWPHKQPNLPLPGRLGLVHCMTRACSLYSVELPPGTNPDQVSEALCLTPGLLSSLSPRFSDGKFPGGDRLLYLSHEAASTSGVHNATAALYCNVWSSFKSGVEKPQVLVDVVQRPTNEQVFPGLYALSLPERPFWGPKRVLVNTQWGNRSEIVAVDISTGDVEPLSDQERWPNSSWTLLNTMPMTGAGHIYASVSSPNSPPEVVFRYNEFHGWVQLITERHERIEKDIVQTLLFPLKISTKQLKAADGLPFDATFILGKPEGKAPGILFLHGGPHSGYTTTYQHSLAFFAALGCNLVVPNYRGSTGYGEEALQSLPGNIGTNDVSDCMTALDFAIEEGLIDRERVAVIGGSHGGFLTGNLVGQHPERFRCGVLRNPVMDLSLMIHVSDIPDWCYIEAWGSEEGKKRMSVKPSAEDLRRFQEVSPIAHVYSVTAPLLFMLGAKDRRVPLIDAQQYVRALRAREGAPEARIWVFGEDTHSLDKPQTDYEQWLNAAWWLKKHLA